MRSFTRFRASAFISRWFAYGSKVVATLVLNMTNFRFLSPAFPEFTARRP
jgi:hypothetical protein